MELLYCQSFVSRLVPVMVAGWNGFASHCPVGFVLCICIDYILFLSASSEPAGVRLCLREEFPETR